MWTIIQHFYLYLSSPHQNPDEEKDKSKVHNEPEKPCDSFHNLSPNKKSHRANGAVAHFDMDSATVIAIDKALPTA
jgi:hypothetical protein